MLTFCFNAVDGLMTETETLTSGMVGKIVKLEFSSDWDNLQKTAVFVAGPTTKDVLNVTDEAVIPHEVLQNYGDRLYVGIYGVAGDGAVTPTIYARGPRISRGADPSGDESAEASPPVWAQLQAQIDDLKNGGTGGGSGSDSTQNPDVTVSGIYAGDEEPTDGSLVWIDTTGDAESLELDNSKWAEGYVTVGGGANAAGENGEMYNTDFLPVNPGEVYTFYNTNSAWSSTWIAVNFYKHDLDTSGYISRVTGNGTSLTFTVPEGASYMMLTSRALSTDSAYLTAAIVASSTIPESGGSGEDSGGDSGETEVTLSSISATYSGGDVAVGTAVTDLAGIMVTAEYSDGSTETVTGYTLSGTIAEGSNTVTVSYGGMTTTFAVTGVAESGGDSGETATMWTAGHVSTTGGTNTSSYQSKGGMVSAEYIPVTAGEVYYIYSTDEGWSYAEHPTGETFAFAGYYDADKNFIERVSGSTCGLGKWVKFTVPDDGAAYMRVSCSNIAGNEESVTVCLSTELPNFEYAFEDTAWTEGYVSTTGAIQAGTAGEMATNLVSVVPGETYRFANSNSEWTSTWIGVGYYSDAAATFVNRATSTSAPYEFTVPDGVQYVALSSRNLTDYYTTATFEKIS